MVIRIRGPKKYRQYNGQKQKVQKDKHGESCGDIDKHGESCGDIDKHGESCGDIDQHGESCGDIDKHGESCGDIDKHGESCGDLDCGFLITEKQCINEPNYMNI